MQQLRLRLALVLPVAQVIVAGVLESYSPHQGLEAPPLFRQICWGINAPALFVRGFGTRILDPMLPVGESIPVDRLCFLVGVFLLWYLVGGALDRRIAGLPIAPRGRKGYAALGFLFLPALDLGFDGLGMLVRLTGRTLLALLFEGWAITLIVGSIRGMAGRIRKEKRVTA